MSRETHAAPIDTLCHAGYVPLTVFNFVWFCHLVSLKLQTLGHDGEANLHRVCAPLLVAVFCLMFPRRVAWTMAAVGLAWVASAMLPPALLLFTVPAGLVIHGIGHHREKALRSAGVARPVVAAARSIATA